MSGEPENVVTPQRTVERREPSTSGLNESEVRLIRETHFQRGEVPICPRDGCLLRVKESRNVAFRGTTLIVHCPECGLAGVLTPPA